MLQIYTENDRKIKGAKPLKAYKNKTILAFSPHPDDLSIGAGGFISDLTKNNRVIPVLGFTGWRGVSGKVTKEKAVATREREMTKEAKVLGMKEPVFLRLASYEKEDSACKRIDCKSIKNVIEQYQPDIILTPSRTDTQPRHKLLTEFVLRTLPKTNQSASIIYYETPWSLFNANQINLVVPLSREAKNKKIKGVKAHHSQLARNDFVKISRAMMEYRALALPEQLIGGFGSKLNLGNWVEAYSSNDKLAA